jgi:lysophospholipase L1-like esterase
VRFLRGFLLVSLLSLLVAGCGAGVTTRPVVYVALGASDAVGVGADDPARDGWVPQLHRRLAPGSRLVNLGISGARLNDALVHQLPVALDAQADLVTVWLVVNDYYGRVALADYERDLELLLARLGDGGRTRIYVGNLPDLGVPSPRGESVAEWNTAIERISVARGATVVDIHGDFAAVGNYAELVSSDGFHPNARGYALLAEAFWRRISG